MKGTRQEEEINSCCGEGQEFGKEVWERLGTQDRTLKSQT